MWYFWVMNYNSWQVTRSEDNGNRITNCDDNSSRSDVVIRWNGEQHYFHFESWRPRLITFFYVIAEGIPFYTDSHFLSSPYLPSVRGKSSLWWKKSESEKPSNYTEQKDGLDRKTEPWREDEGENKEKKSILERERDETRKICTNVEKR